MAAQWAPPVTQPPGGRIFSGGKERVCGLNNEPLGWVPLSGKHPSSPLSGLLEIAANRMVACNVDYDPAVLPHEDARVEAIDQL